MKNIYLHFGFPRTGTTTMQLHLFPNHPQINYLGRHPIKEPYLKLIDLVCNTKDQDYELIYKDLIKICSKFQLYENKTNILSSEFIISYATHYNNLLDSNHNICRTLKRIDNLFQEIGVNVNFFCTIRNQSNIIPSFYVAASPELNRSMQYKAEDIIEYIKSNKTNNIKIQNFLDGFKYYKLLKDFQHAFDCKKNLKFFLYEQYEKEFPTHLSNYLNIDEKMTKKCLEGKRENASSVVLNENHLINSTFSIIKEKLKKNFSLNLMLKNFDKKVFNFYFLLKKALFKKNSNIIKKNLVLQKSILSGQLSILKSNSLVIKNYYKEDNLNFLNETNIKIDKYNYV